MSEEGTNTNEELSSPAGEIQGVTRSQVHTYNNMDEFANFLGSSGFFMMEPYLATFYDAYMGINKGCGCSRKKRVNDALILYKALKEQLTFGTMNAIRSAVAANQVELKHDNELIISF